MVKAAIFGASGYTGAELLRLLSDHPGVEVVVATGGASAGTAVADVYPSLAAAYPGLRFEDTHVSAAAGCDVAFLGLPHGQSQQLVPALVDEVPVIVDLAADFRLRDAGAYPAWYGAEHACPDLLDLSVHGIPELFRSEITGAKLVAAAGCYVTAASLALAPFVRADAVERSGLIVDAASGISGAGRVPKDHTHFPAANEDFTAYGLLDHRHTPEIEQAIGAQVLFTPHLAPMTRGILATCYARPAGPLDTAAALDLLEEAYRDEPFVVVSERVPSTKAALGSNTCHLTARVDGRTGWLVVIAALDNLVKGASGQAIQCANLALGLAETDGLPTAAVYP